MRKILVFILLVLFISGTAIADISVDLEMLSTMIFSNPKTIISETEGVALLRIEEVPPGSTIRYEWTVHTIRIWFHPNISVKTIEFLVKKYKDTPITGRTWKEALSCEELIFVDHFLDGQLDGFSKDYFVVVDGDAIFQDWPDDFRNMKYYTPSEEEKHRLYKDEINYLLNNIK